MIREGKLALFTWEDFNESVSYLTDLILHHTSRKLTAVYGEPRGGLPLAVALSHSLKLPLLTRVGWSRKRHPDLLWCDDIIDTEHTIERRLHRVGLAAVLISSESRFHAGEGQLLVANPKPRNAWIVFPWERRPTLEEVRAERQRLASR